MTNSRLDKAVAPPRLTRQALSARLARALVRRGPLTEEQIDEWAKRADRLGERLERVLIKESVLPEQTVLQALSEVTGIPFGRIVDFDIRPGAVEWVPVRTALHYGIMPLELEQGTITIATNQVHDVTDEDSLRVLLGFSVRWVLCAAHEIAESIKHFYGVGADTLQEILPASPAESVAALELTDSAADAENPVLVRFIRQVLRDAVQMGATDVHFEPFERRTRLRYRVDGVLYTIPVPEGLAALQKAVVSCLKVMANLDIAEKRLPHDGRIDTVVDGEKFDVRVSVLPTQFGEAVNLRILNRKATFLGMRELGLRDEQFPVLARLTVLSHGIVLLTGPTGSGKTTTLYATLARINKEAMNIVTIEDPVEYQIEGISQMQVHPQIGLTFAAGLRSILRHDPDVILVGEIRDRETADIAIRAALTGHLVFSTLHTNDSAGAVTRLTDMGIEPYLVASSVEGIVAQRLVRRVCPACGEADHVDAGTLAEIAALFPERAAQASFRRGRGCPDCRFTGYHGRRAIFEIMTLNDELRALIVQRASSKDIMKRAVTQGLTTLRGNGWASVLDGVTTVEDVLRVTHDSDDSRRERETAR
ncbi:MAG: type II/IV secretion system protein [Kiritimatiellae bacterium]|nr:type II/IV secretion system protein [Kiritimatiellia bacterium]